MVVLGIDIFVLFEIIFPNRRGVGHIVFGADPVGVGVRVASFPHVIC